MYPRSGRVSNSVFYETNSTRSLVITLLLTLTIIAAVLASLAIGYRSGFAMGPEAASECPPACAASGAIPSPTYGEGDSQPDLSPNAISPMDSAIGGRTDGSVSTLSQPEDPRPGNPD